MSEFLNLIDKPYLNASYKYNIYEKKVQQTLKNISSAPSTY